MVWRSLLESAEQALRRRNEARWVIERVSGLEGAELMAALDEQAPARAVAWSEEMVRRRGLGEPLQYVLGRWGFRGLDLLVDRRVLIPRPETEVVVEIARAELAALGAGGQVVDLGTGSGAIALALAVEVPGATVWATDISSDALAVARANLAGIGGRPAARVRLVQGDWYGALPVELWGALELVVSNPPYVSEPEEAELPAEVAGWEPRSALVAGPSGLESIAVVVAGAPGWLRRPGSLVVELAPHQAVSGVAMALAAGFDSAEVVDDLAGRPRVLVARVG